MLSPDDRVVLVSGAGRGMGRAIAQRLHADGYRLSLGVRDPDSVAGDLRRDEGRVLVCRYDALDAATSDAWIAATVGRFGGIDGLVNNAGIHRQVPIEDTTEADLDEIWAVNVKGPFLMTQKALPHLRRCGSGRIVNIASISGKRIAAQYAVYPMSKFAVVAMSHATRFLGWEHGIRVTAICPGLVNTDMGVGVGAVPEAEMTQPETIAGLVAHVLSLPNNASVVELPVNCVLESGI